MRCYAVGKDLEGNARSLRSTLQFKYEMKAVDKGRTQQAGWVPITAEIRKLYCNINLEC